MTLRFLVLALPLVLCASARSDAAETLVTVNGPATVTLCGDCQKPQARVQITLADGVSSPDVTVEDVKLSGVSIGDPAKAFVPRLEPDKDHPRAIVVESAVARAGTYQVTLLVACCKGKQQQLVLSIVQPAGKLSVPSLLHVDRTTYPFFVSDVKAPLVVYETTRAAKVQLDAAHQTQTFVSGAKAVDGVITFTTPQTIDAGKPVTVPYNVTNDFPLGTSTGAAMLYSEQLAEPVNVLIEVRTHRSTVLIPLIVIAGLLVSWYLKVKIQSDVNFLTAKERGLELQRRVDHLLADNPDADLAHNVSGEKTDLGDALNGTDPAAIEAARTKLDTKMQSELQLLATRRAAAEQRLRDWMTFASTTWSFARPFRDYAAAVRDELDHVAALLARNDVARAAAELDTIGQRMPGGFAATARAWVQATTDAISRITARRDGMLKDTTAWAADQAAKTNAVVAAAKNVTDNASVAQLIAAAQSAAAAKVAADEFFHTLGNRLRLDAGTARAALTSAMGRSDGAIDALSGAADAAGITLDGLSDDPDVWNTTGSKVLDDLRATWTGALVNQLAGTDQRDIADLIAAHDYQAALDRTLALIRAAAGNESVELKGPGGREAGGPQVVPVALGSLPSAAPPTFFGRAPSAPFLSWSSTVARLYETASELKVAKGKQTAVLAIIFCILGYTTYSGKFVGTFDELASIFFWAFGLDLTIDTVNRLVKK